MSLVGWKAYAVMSLISIGQGTTGKMGRGEACETLPAVYTPL